MQVALTEDSEGEIWGVRGMIAISVPAGKHRLIISIVSDGVSEIHAIFDCFVCNFGQLLPAIATAKYGQGDVGLRSCSVYHTDCTCEIEVLS